jgi:hypothetical protein
MTEALVVASPRTRRNVEQAPPLALAPALGVSETKRAWNHKGVGRVGQLRCECEEPTCVSWLPAVAEAHRGEAECFIVMPTHANGSVVVRAADRFFVVAISH